MSGEHTLWSEGHPIGTPADIDRVAQAIADAIIAQDWMSDPVPLEDGKIAYLDQGVTDMRLVAIAAIAAIRAIARS